MCSYGGWIGFWQKKFRSVLYRIRPVNVQKTIYIIVFKNAHYKSNYKIKKQIIISINLYLRRLKRILTENLSRSFLKKYVQQMSNKDSALFHSCYHRNIYFINKQIIIFISVPGKAEKDLDKKKQFRGILYRIRRAHVQ